MIKLWLSTADLYRRFGIVRPDKELAFAMLQEECGEFIQAFRDGDKRQASLEAVDVIVCIMGCLMSIDSNYMALQVGINHTIAKNDGKTPETHAINEAGKIARK